MTYLHDDHSEVAPPTFAENVALWTVAFTLPPKQPHGYRLNQTAEVVAESLLVAVAALMQAHPEADIHNVSRRSKSTTFIVAGQLS